MVSTTLEADRICRIVIRPNRSLTWRQAQLFFASIALVSLGIATWLAVLGFWPVLPFAGAELALLAGALYACALRTHSAEVVSVDGSTVAVEKGRRAPEQRWEFPRAWTRVRLLRSAARWYPSRLVVGSHGRTVTVGEFLNEEERRHLAGYLRSAIEAAPGPAVPAAGGAATAAETR